MLDYILTINGGSSSIKFALYQAGRSQRLLAGKVDRIGLTGTNLAFHDPSAKALSPLPIRAANHRTAAGFLVRWLEQRHEFPSIAAVGHAKWI
jgi:acetate kinase